MSRIPRARFLAGAFLLCMFVSRARGAERLHLAAERSDGGCSPDGEALVLALLDETSPPGIAAASCFFLVRLSDLDDARIEQAAQRL
ncbi:MAG TPA: hypothetical protein VEO02_01185, partial [Thermoanaerobaculia bacterium]|nr:hypothetical protein [Thermoanaerobaculia bacterium]